MWRICTYLSYLWRICSNFSHEWQIPANSSHLWQLRSNVKVKRICHMCEKFERICRTCEEFVRLFHRCEKYVLTLASVKDARIFQMWQIRANPSLLWKTRTNLSHFVIRTLDMCDIFIKKSICNAFISRPPISLSTTLCCEKKYVEETSGCS